MNEDSNTFASIYASYKELDNSEHPSSSVYYQDIVSKAIRNCEALVKSINEKKLFSENESIIEVDTDHLRYFLCPALLGHLTSKLSNNDHRYEILMKAKAYFKDFLRLCRLYDVKALPADSEDDDECDEEHVERKKKPKTAMERKEEKVRRYKEKRVLDNKIKSLTDQTDDSTKREFYMSLLLHWMITVQEELEFIKDEIPILEHMAKLKAQGTGRVDLPPIEKSKPLRPFILTKTDLQKQVFGAGYPSVPTYTLDEFYDSQVRAGQIPQPGQGGAAGAAADDQAAELEAIVKEFKLENDDPEELAKARELDDWKDNHRRGWGNRKNMG